MWNDIFHRRDYPKEHIIRVNKEPNTYKNNNKKWMNNKNGNVKTNLDSPMKMDDVKIDYVDDNAFLLVILDYHLSRKAQIRQIKSTISKSLSIMSKVKHLLDKKCA